MENTRWRRQGEEGEIDRYEEEEREDLEEIFFFIIKRIYKYFIKFYI